MSSLSIYAGPTALQLIDEIRKTPIHVLIAGIAQPNPGSVALHEKMGI
ncbi:MAG: hypothetical protein IIC10_10075 [Proteobacteria bacterium]|nr:hypothetical protein [Pseudomonadota bacterium]